MLTRPEDDGHTTSRNLYAAHKRWADKEGLSDKLSDRERLGSMAFRRKLKELHADRHRASSKETPARYLGIHLRTVWTPCRPLRDVVAGLLSVCIAGAI